MGKLIIISATTISLMSVLGFTLWTGYQERQQEAQRLEQAERMRVMVEARKAFCEEYPYIKTACGF